MNIELGGKIELTFSGAMFSDPIWKSLMTIVALKLYVRWFKLRLNLNREKRIEKKVSWRKVLPFHFFRSFNKDGRETKWTDGISSNWWKFFHPKLEGKWRKLVGRQRIFLIWQFYPLKVDTKRRYSRYILELICKSINAKLSEFYTFYTSN